MAKIIGTITRYTGTEHPYLIGHDLRIIAIIKGGADPAVNPDDVDILRSDEDVETVGGVSAGDRAEVQPYLESEGRYSWVTSDPRIIDLASFEHLTKER